jgi:hypothetical protein
MKYETTNDIEELVSSFEKAELSRDDWRHSDHLVVALYYLSHHDLETATNKMRSGILNLLANGFKVNLSEEMPYHETLTVFWMRTIADFNASKNGEPLISKTAEMVERFDKDYPLRFYSRELLFSDEARARFLEGDLKTIQPS